MLARSPVVEEFYNHVHGKGGRFASGHAASGREGFREGSHSGRGASTGKVAKTHDAYVNIGGKLRPVSVKAHAKWSAAGKPTIYNQRHFNKVAGQEQMPVGLFHSSKSWLVQNHKSHTGTTAVSKTFHQIQQSVAGKGKPVPQRSAKFDRKMMDRLVAKGRAVTPQQARQTVMDDLNKISKARAEARKKK